ncbi:DNA topoisomerase III [Alkalihalobacterium chitinilyticum]|uniref:DNA topoisomerase 3 n=1 Tax=Alkalihalobacterium chitinilyticum TaxID=2980103 RepID=A0ABT5VBB0_9BACI|nr:DNA topoisomerase III [Alkalihalobacterium chitinilyticum]MDE5412735.1 DNA topoisomerase III [Alkalihalobacterium chitinilyticum]
MKKTVVLAEKPSVGRDIAKVLNCSKKGNGFFEGDRYIVTWALGHLVTLADPESYDEKYKSWNLDDLPMLPQKLKIIVIKKTNKQFQAVKAQLNRKDVGDIVIATDAGREGELVARWIIEKASVKKPIKRLWISSVTDKAIKEGFQKLRPGKDYENLYSAAVARAEADWIVGLNGTRALTSKYNAQLSCGRVQTPTLAIIHQREREINEFKPKKYYGVTVRADKTLKLTWQDTKTKEFRTFDLSQVKKVQEKISNQPIQIIDIEKKSKKTYSPQLFDLTELQREANRIFGFSAKETLNTMQKLYEQHKVLTYPRTDSRYLSDDIVETLKDRLDACGVGPYSKHAFKIAQKPIKANRHFVDNQKVSDHHAIIPTEVTTILSSLSEKERKIYDLVVKRFLAVLSPPYEYEQTTVVTKIGGETFIAKGNVLQSLGWKEIYGDDSDEKNSDMSNDILLLTKGDTLSLQSVSQTEGETEPPGLFNEGTLLSAMENPAKFMAETNKDLAKTLGKTGGLGTVATRADIIEKLFNSFLIEKRGKDIVTTSKGRQLLELVPSDLKSPALTGEWEQKLEAIAKGKLTQQAFLVEMKEYTKAIIREIKVSEQKFKHDNISGRTCPECGKNLLQVNGKKGKMLVCEDRECGHRKAVAKKTNSRCPKCFKKLELRGQGEGQVFACSCGHKEKLSTFNERKKKEKNTKVSKKEVNQYLKKQDKQEEPFNPALAEALAKLNLKK